MRRLFWLVIVLAALWSGWWLLAATLAERGLTNWLDAPRSDGWQAAAIPQSVTGFPFTLTMQVDAIKLEHQAAGIAVQGETLGISVPTYWPGDVSVWMPDTPVTIGAHGGLFRLTAPDALARLQLHPSPTLALEALSATSGRLLLNGPQGDLATADGFHTSISETSNTPATYRLEMRADALAPGDLVRMALGLPETWPRVFDAFNMNMTVGLEAPIDRFTLQNEPPQPRKIDLENLDLRWGDLRVSGQGSIAIDDTGTPDGNLNLYINNWRQIFDLKSNNVFINLAVPPQSDLMLNALANMNGDPNTLDLTLTFQDGKMSLGPIPLGPAPRFRF